jgi:hypothetical protein
MRHLPRAEERAAMRRQTAVVARQTIGIARDVRDAIKLGNRMVGP